MATPMINVTIHFSNGVSIERGVPLKKALKFLYKNNLIIPEDTDYIEVCSINSSVIVPLNMTFVIPTSPEFRNVESVSRYMLYKRDDGKCSYCGKEISQHEATIDHIIPKAQGGKTVWENVALSCRRCNCLKDSRTPEQAKMKLKITPYNPKRKRK